MGRGSAGAISEAFYLVANRQGNVNGTELEGLGEIEVDGEEWLALKVLVSLAWENDEEPGFNQEVICEAAEFFKREHGTPGDLPTEAVLAGMEEKGLIEKTEESIGVFKEPPKSEKGWKPTIAGIQWLGMFMTADWESATVESHD